MPSTKKKLLFPATMTRAGWELLKARDDVEAQPFEHNIAKPAFHAILRDAVGVGLSLTPFTAAEAEAAPALRVVSRHGVGYDAVDVGALTRRNIPLMVTGTANSPSVAEQALHFMLALAKLSAPMHALVRDNRWGERLSGDVPADLYGKTVLVIGFGRTGSRVAKMCLALEMNVLVYDPYLTEDTIRKGGATAVKELDGALARADFVTIHCPKTSETTGLVNAARLAKMKPTAFLVNTARGGIIDEAALHTALTAGTIKAAGLDVFDREPPANDNPLLRLPNVLAAPHMAGVTRESLDRMAIATVQNALDVLDGKPKVDNVVNKEVLGAPSKAVA